MVKAQNLKTYYVVDGFGLSSGIRILAPNWRHACRLFKQHYPKEYARWGLENLHSVQPEEDEVKRITKKQRQFYKEMLTGAFYEPATMHLLHNIQNEGGVLHQLDTSLLTNQPYNMI